VALGVPGMVPLDGGLPFCVEEDVVEEDLVEAIGVSGVQSAQDGIIVRRRAQRRMGPQVSEALPLLYLHGLSTSDCARRWSGS
jgi:hypothetical protein